MKQFGLLHIATFERDVKHIGAFSSINVDMNDLGPGIWLLWAAESSTVEYLNQSIYLLKREMLLLPGDESPAKELASFNGRVLYVPISALDLPEQFIDFALYRPIQPGPGWADILSAYLGSLNLATLGTADASPVGRKLVERHTLGLLRLMLSALSQAPSCPVPVRRSPVGRAELWTNLQAWMREHYSDTNVSAQSAAEHFSVSTRYIHKLFADFGEGKSFRGLLQELRLSRAKDMLRNDFYTDLTVAEIGWFCGYADSVYFGKAFRKHSGMSPGQFRLLGCAQQKK